MIQKIVLPQTNLIVSQMLLSTLIHMGKCIENDFQSLSAMCHVLEQNEILIKIHLYTNNSRLWEYKY